MPRSRIGVVALAALLLWGCTSEGDVALCTFIEGLDLPDPYPYGILLDSVSGAEHMEMLRSADDGILRGLFAANEYEAALNRCREIGALRQR